MEPTSEELASLVAARLRGLVIPDVEAQVANDDEDDDEGFELGASQRPPKKKRTVASEPFDDIPIRPLDGPLLHGSRRRTASWIWLGKNLTEDGEDPECKFLLRSVSLKHC
jgi:hypothetical protein